MKLKQRKFGKQHGEKEVGRVNFWHLSPAPDTFTVSSAVTISAG